MGSGKHGTPRTVWILTQDGEYLVTLAHVLLDTVSDVHAHASAVLAILLGIERASYRRPWGLVRTKPRNCISGQGICRIPTSFAWQRRKTSAFNAANVAAPLSRAFWFRMQSIARMSRRLRLSTSDPIPIA
jgi:hypothetical protein